MGTKHTSGTWKHIGLEIRHTTTSMILANVYQHLEANQSREEAEANAKLMAAAPELLEMAVWTLNDLLSGQIDSEETREQAIQNLKDVIGKAI